MKKVLSIVLALVLCLGVALAAAPSKTTQDLLPSVEAVAENGRTVTIIIKEDAYADDQLKNLKATPVMDDYFGDIIKQEGTTAKLSELMDGDPDINEFFAMDVLNYDESYGFVTAKLKFATPYATTDKVVVLVGLLDGTVTWYAFEGTVIDNQGTIQVVFTPDIMTKVQEGTGLIAIASKSAAPADGGASDGASAGAPAEEAASDVVPVDEAPADGGASDGASGGDSAGAPGGEGN